MSRSCDVLLHSRETRRTQVHRAEERCLIKSFLNAVYQCCPRMLKFQFSLPNVYVSSTNEYVLSWVHLKAFKNLSMGAGVMVCLLAILTALAEDLGSIPSTHMAVHNHMELQFQGLQCPLLAISKCLSVS